MTTFKANPSLVPLLMNKVLINMYVTGGARAHIDSDKLLTNLVLWKSCGNIYITVIYK